MLDVQHTLDLVTNKVMLRFLMFNTHPHLECVAHLHQPSHVDLVEGGQHRVRVLCALEALSYTQAQPGHLHTPVQLVDWFVGVLIVSVLIVSVLKSECEWI